MGSLATGAMMDEELRQAGARVDAFLRGTELSRADDGDCNYLPGRTSRSEGFRVVGGLDGGSYRALMDRGFRRSGCIVYRPACAACRACVPIRVPVAAFRVSRSQRRVWRRNADLRVEVGDGQPSDDKYALFMRYQREHHDGTMAFDRDSFARFCYGSPVAGVELCSYAGRRLIGVSLLDQVPDALSSVYMFFDPGEARRSPGTYSVLWEIDYCRARGLGYYYLGYYVAGSRTMGYKGNFQPAELLHAARGWQPFAEAALRGT